MQVEDAGKGDIESGHSCVGNAGFLSLLSFLVF